MEKDVVVFGNERIRRVWVDTPQNGHTDTQHKNLRAGDSGESDWFYSVVDVVGVLTESLRARKYWGDLKFKLVEEGFEVSDIIGRLKMKATDGKMRETDVANLKGIFRVIQSIPSKKAEPFKLWLAKVGSERVDEMDDPELAIDRAMRNYLNKGYGEKWINQRLKTIEVRKELTDEWKRAGVNEGQEFAILTNEITLAWSGKSIREYKNLKGLRKENLRDNMTNLELVLNMLAEATTSEISREEDPIGMGESFDVARRGGGVAGVAREKVEGELGRGIVSSKNSEDIINSDMAKVYDKKKGGVEADYEKAYLEG